MPSGGLFSDRRVEGLRMRWRLAVAFLLLAAGPGAVKDSYADKKEEKLDGYAEWRRDSALIVDGQRLTAAPRAQLKLPRGVSSLADVPLGAEVRAKGIRAADGTILAREIEVKPNGTSMFEKE